MHQRLELCTFFQTIFETDMCVSSLTLSQLTHDGQREEHVPGHDGDDIVPICRAL
jgi:hypothetical protein